VRVQRGKVFTSTAFPAYFDEHGILSVFQQWYVSYLLTCINITMPWGPVTGSRRISTNRLDGWVVFSDITSMCYFMLTSMCYFMCVRKTLFEKTLSLNDQDFFIKTMYKHSY